MGKGYGIEEKILYLCNGEKESCNKRNCYKNGGPCMHTSEIESAINFKKDKYNEEVYYTEKVGGR